MTERCTSAVENRKAVLNYYQAAEAGYWGDLKGRCHYGYTSEDDQVPFNMEAAQIEMERKLGRVLNLPSGSKVLDAGCGYCPVARTLTSEFCFEVTGVDLIQRRLRMGLEINRSTNNAVGLVRGDYQYLPFADESFDGVYTMETLVHAHDFTSVLGEFWRVLKPGGRVALLEYSIPDLDSVPAIPRSLAKRVIKNTGMASLPSFIHGAFPEILKEAGFENVEVEDVSRNVYPSWFYLWKLALKTSAKDFSQGKISLDCIPGSAWIWPARRRLGYNVCIASKSK